MGQVCLATFYYKIIEEFGISFPFWSYMEHVHNGVIDNIISYIKTGIGSITVQKLSRWRSIWQRVYKLLLIAPSKQHHPLSPCEDWRKK